MKQLLKGDVQAKGAPKEVFLGACPSCKAVYAKERSTLGKLEGGDYRSDHEYFAFDNCADCGRRVTFYSMHTRSGQAIMRDRGMTADFVKKAFP